MPDQATSDQITKSEAATIYRRSERSLSRDITNAIKFHEIAVLQNVELQLEDGRRRPGGELTIEEIVDLRDRGLNPTWLLQRNWLENKYGRRDEPPPREPQIQPTLKSATAVSVPLPEELPQRVAVLMTQNEALKQTNADLRAQAERLEKELDRRAEERREENELQKQNNVLMQQVYDLLSKMQQSPGQINILNQARELPAVIPEIATSRMQPSVDMESQPVAERNKLQRKGSQFDNKPIARKKRSPAKRPTKSPLHTKTVIEDGKKRSANTISKYLPTLDRAVRSFFLGR